MNNNNSNQEQINRIINNLTQKINSNQANSIPKEKDVNDLLRGLNKSQADRVKRILSNPEATRKILESEQAQELLKKFGDKNK
ncbi:MAG: hypothetical protein PUD24_04635 [Oscillospiraceae bacterium]|nr:hypothetical protein [Oscillospiraceae bacterium]